jgi:hypothetical protein
MTRVVMRRLVPFLLLLSLIACGPVPHPQPPQPAPSWALDVQVSDNDGGVADAQVRIVDGPNKGVTARTDATGRVLLTNLQQSGFTVCSSKGVEYQETCAGITLTSSQNVTLKLFRQWADLPAIRADGHVFRLASGPASGMAWRYKGVSAFALLHRFELGQDISDTLNAYKNIQPSVVCADSSGCRYNVLRVWTYTPTLTWGARAWPFPQSPETVVKFLQRVSTDGFYVELTLLTDSDPSQVPKAQALAEALVAAKPSNLLLEAGNEPEVQTAPNHNYDTGALRSTLSASGFQFASGNYTGGAARWYGSYLTTHSARSVEWPRYAHDCYDYWVKPSDAPAGAVAVHAPCVLDEPAKPTSGGLGGTSKTDDWRAYFGAASIFGAGATFHSETGLDGLPPTADELTLAKAALDGLDAFTADAPNAQATYRRIDGDGLRTYVIGNSMVRIRPNRPAAPEPGWIGLDSSGILWRR